MSCRMSMLPKVLLPVFVLFCGFCLAQDFAIKTIRPETSVRRMADPQSEVAMVAPEGMLFQCHGQDGDWYEVIVPANSRRQAFIGFIHRNDVERIGAQKEERAAKTQDMLPPPRPIYQNPQRPLSAGPMQPNRFSFGFGFGIPFGVIGISLEFNHSLLMGKSDSLSNYYTINVGLGYPVVGLGYSVGLRIYPMGRMKDFQPKISVQYGTAVVYNWEELWDGISLGAGLQYRLSRKLWIDSDIIFIVSYTNSSNGWVKLSSGLRWHFN